MRITISDEVAEVLFNALRKNIDCDCCPAYKNEDMCKRCTQGGYIPSVTQKSGKWIEKDGWDGDVYYECSVCEESFCLIDGTPTDNMYNYCPNCGAKMESEDKQ